MSTKNSSILNLLTWQNVPVAFFAVFFVIWYGHPIRIRDSFFCRFQQWFTNYRTAGERRGRHFFRSSLLLPATSQTLRHQPGNYCRGLTSALLQRAHLWIHFFAGFNNGSQITGLQGKRGEAFLQVLTTTSTHITDAQTLAR